MQGTITPILQMRKGKLRKETCSSSWTFPESGTASKFFCQTTFEVKVWVLPLLQAQRDFTSCPSLTWSQVSRSMTSSVARSSCMSSPGTSSIWEEEESLGKRSGPPSPQPSPPGQAPHRELQSWLGPAGDSFPVLCHRSASPCPCCVGPRDTPPHGKAGAHHKTADLVGAGKEARRVGVHLLVLQPWGRAVGSLPAQGLPEAVCEEGHTDWLPPDSTASLALLIRCRDRPYLTAHNCSQSPPTVLKSQGA